jgi:hypothetical protein
MPERLMLFGSGIAFLLGFFSWYSVSSTMMGKSFGGGVSGFNPWYGKLFFVTSLATVVLLAAPALRQSLLGKQPAKTQRLVFLGLVAASVLFGPLWFIIDAGGVNSFSMPEVSAGRTIWCWLALLAAGAALVGGIMHLKEEQASS